MVKLRRSRIGKGIRHKYVLGQAMPSERMKYLQSEINKLDAIIGAQAAIGVRYKGMKEILEDFRKDMRYKEEGGLFDREEQVRYPEGKHKNERVWNLNDPNIKKKIDDYKKRLEAMFDDIKWIDSNDKKIEKEEAEIRDIASKDFKDMIKSIDVEFGQLVDILNRFKEVWKKIKELQKEREDIIGDIKEKFIEFKKSIEEDLAYIYNKENRDYIDQILSTIKKLKSKNNKLERYLDKEAKIEGEEHQLVEMLLRGLIRSNRRFSLATRMYEGFYIHPHLMPKYSHFETNLNRSEQRIIIEQVAPLIARLYHLTVDLRKLMKDEDGKIKSFEDYTSKIDSIQERKKVGEGEKRKLGIDVRNLVIELERLITAEEKALADKIEHVEGMIEGAVDKVKEIENRREGIEKQMLKELEPPGFDIS